MGEGLGWLLVPAPDTGEAAFDAGVDMATAADDTGVGLVVGISGIGVNETVAAAVGAGVGWGVLAVIEEMATVLDEVAVVPGEEFAWGIATTLDGVAAGVVAEVAAAFGVGIGGGVG